MTHLVDREPTARDVLCVTYFFPPLGGVSVARMTAFVRHLPQAGWRPVILAPRGTTYPLRDPGGLAALPAGLEIIRAPSPEPHGLRRRLAPLRRPLSGLLRRADGPGPGSDRSGVPVVSGSHSGRLAALRRAVFFPDDQLAWVPFAAAAGIRRARRMRPDVIFSSAFPISAHLVAGAIHRATGIPWVAEFRDPWVDNVLAPALPDTHRRLQRRIERWVVSHAARTVLVTPRLASAFAQRYPDLADRMRTVMNGYDREERPPATEGAEPVDDTIRLVYTGTLDRPRETVAFLDGVERFVAERPEARRRLRIELIGRRSQEVDSAMQPYGEPGRLGDVLAVTDFMPRAAALERVQRATATLVLLGGGPGMDLFVSGKLFDAIGLDRPVLAMVPPGDARDVLTGLDWGVVADPEAGSVAAALERVWTGAYRTGTADPEGRFDRRRLTEDLAAILAEAADVGQP